MYLAAISGQPPASDSATWVAWWRKNEASFQFPPAGPAGVAAPLKAVPPMAGGANYYGLQLLADRMVFVLDTSNSMRGPRIAAAKRELINAIAGLPDRVLFTVVVFDARVSVWQKSLVPANSLSKLQAEAFVAEHKLGLGTASYNALESALEFDAEAIYFLTDGAPFGGKIDNVVEIVNVITRVNRAKRASINTFGIGVGLEGNPFDQFLQSLAARNYGVYRRVNE